MTGAIAPAASLEARYAVAYADHEWPVFPLWELVGHRCGCEDRDCASPGKHPVPSGWQNTIASVTAAESMWAGRLAGRGVGIALGERAGMWVLDVDPQHDGDRHLAELEAEHGPLPPSLRVQTGGGGEHVYFRWPIDGDPITNANALPDGLDTRGQGGYVVLPPSLHVSGERYRWRIPPKEGTLEPAPGWLLELARARTPSLFSAANSGEPLLVPIGRRHRALVGFCGLLRSAGLEEEALVECGTAFLRHHVEIDEQRRPLDWAHAERTMRGIARRYPPVINR